MDEMAVVQHCKDEVRLQQCANTIALMARNLSKDSKVRLLVFGSDRSSRSAHPFAYLKAPQSLAPTCKLSSICSLSNLISSLTYFVRQTELNIFRLVI